jgi:DNA-directed RNA polymerase subunit RPC12/RpoP
MSQCERCGGRLKRVHRTFLERFRYLAVFECQDCLQQVCVPRQYRYHFGEEARCPHCGTTRLSKLKERDGIDPMESGVLNLVEHLAGGRLYHCCFCRIQFYDRRSAVSRAPSEADPEELKATGAASAPATTPRDTAISDG